MEHEKTPSRYYLVGGGIASLAAAVFIVRDAGVSGDQITIFEQLDRVGGSLDGRGDPVSYVFWGYGVRSDRTGDFVKKPLEDCTGNEIIDELAGQLRLGEVERA
jgi:myosin-crossreactive antigen